MDKTHEDVKAELVRTWGEVLTTDEATAKYTFEGFGGGLVVVTRKSDGVRGSLNFTHIPRYYFDFMEA
jgi:hypothetical protein